MKIRIVAPPDWSITRNLTSWARRLKIPLAGAQSDMDALIIIGNGTPDDVVLLILTHKMDGDHVVGITKPKERLGTASISLIRQYLRISKNLIFVIDQEKDTLEDIWRRVDEKLQGNGIASRLIEEDKRIKIFDCSLGSYKFKVSIVINGLNGQYQKHTIEEHLIEYYRRVLGGSLSNVADDPKDIWESLGERLHKDIYCKLLNSSKDEIKEIFPLHIKALEAVCSK